MNKFSLIELPDNKMQFDITGNKSQISVMIFEAMRDNQAIREIVLAGVVVWAQRTGIDLELIIRKGTQEMN